jgi:hypothetical protein
MHKALRVKVLADNIDLTYQVSLISDWPVSGDSFGLFGVVV